ncbi:uncharacterized protein LOC114357922 [Ostrinia furnacalis]|uniref:uncharacterized protein LOC114357922 n=1 Tax=Ostrinia furnacalis TaxID=93504 RepID=UPI00103FFF1C|nr:uncharacterized protein LOC114357922 [Ostrinia furnacalis]XP_028167530.1 uncharacterized protein LOC114357922 [Ostrinia furnacalis]
MPKRSAEEQIAYYTKKIKKLKSKESKRRKRVIVYSDSSDSEENLGVAINENIADSETTARSNNDLEASTSDQGLNLMDNDQSNNDPETSILDTTLPSLDPDVLIALGELLPEEVTYGEDIHPDLAQRWAPILRKGLPDKEQKEKLVKEYAIPKNCKLFRAPLLNPEIAAAVSEFARTRDKKIECSQQQLGVGLTAINRAMTLLLTSDNKIQAIKCLSDACRVLSDLHASETQTRTKSLTQGLEKSFLNLIQDTERDELLFGAGLPEKIKASKAIEKQGSQIKKPDNKTNPGTSASRTTRPQGNWRGPSRSTPNRGGRGGSRKPYTNQKPATQQTSFNPSRVWNKPPRAGPRT